MDVWNLHVAHSLPHNPGVACVVRRWHDLILQSADDIATIMTFESGKPLAEAKAEIAGG